MSFMFSQESVFSWRPLSCDTDTVTEKLTIRSVILALYRHESEKQGQVEKIFFQEQKSRWTLYQLKKFNDKYEGVYQDSSELSTKVLLMDNVDLQKKWLNRVALERDSFLVKVDSVKSRFSRQYPKLKIKVVSDLRDRKSQQKYLKKGTTRALVSMHELGLAVDFAIYQNKRYLKSATYYREMGMIAKNLGLTWGGDFVGFVDMPHVQYFDNSAALIKKHPELSVEYDFFYNQHQDKVLQKLNVSKEHEVRDTQELLQELNNLRRKEACLCNEKAAYAKLPDLPMGYDEKTDLIIFSGEKNEIYVKFPGNTIKKFLVGSWR